MTDNQPVAQICPVTQLHYLAAGTGEQAVVFVHGWSAFKEIWWSTILALAPYMRVFAPDLPGHGDSTTLAARDMQASAELVYQFCLARGLSEWALVGHSMGGNIVAELALAWPEHVSKLILVNPAIQGSQMPAYTRSYLWPLYGWPALRASIALARRISPLGAQVPHAHGGGLIRPILRRTHYLARHDPERLHLMLHALFDNPVLQRLPQIAQPTLVIAGQFDPLVPIRLSREVSRAIPGARFVRMPLCAHNPMDEQPQAFNTIIREFLQGSGRGI